MARELEYIKIPTTFFTDEHVAELHCLPDGDGTILLYIELLCAAYRKSRTGEFRIGNIVLTDDILCNIFTFGDLQRFETLESYQLIKRCEKAVVVYKYWEDKHDRSSTRYCYWRTSVFQRDRYRCRICGTQKDLQAHHIEHWKNNKELRYDTDNGITLCRKCHLKEHGGSWRSG